MKKFLLERGRHLRTFKFMRVPTNDERFKDEKKVLRELFADRRSVYDSSDTYTALDQVAFGTKKRSFDKV
jgi:hypothetical protein